MVLRPSYDMVVAIFLHVVQDQSSDICELPTLAVTASISKIEQFCGIKKIVCQKVIESGGSEPFEHYQSIYLCNEIRHSCVHGDLLLSATERRVERKGWNP